MQFSFIISIPVKTSIKQFVEFVDVLTGLTIEFRG